MMNINEIVVEINSGRIGKIEKISLFNDQKLYTVVFEDTRGDIRPITGRKVLCFAAGLLEQHIRPVA